MLSPAKKLANLDKLSGNKISFQTAQLALISIYFLRGIKIEINFFAVKLKLSSVLKVPICQFCDSVRRLHANVAPTSKQTLAKN
jgi:hypothetical protein